MKDIAKVSENLWLENRIRILNVRISNNKKIIKMLEDEMIEAQAEMNKHESKEKYKMDVEVTQAQEVKNPMKIRKLSFSKQELNKIECDRELYNQAIKC